jgi:hypothetical protein
MLGGTAGWLGSAKMPGGTVRLLGESDRLPWAAMTPVSEPYRRRVTPRQIDYWRRSGLIRPGTGELAQARVIAALRQAGVSLRRIRAVVDRLRTPGGTPLLELGFAVQGRELYVRHPGGVWEGDRRPGQLILDHVLPLRPVDPAVVSDRPPQAPPARPRGRGPGRRIGRIPDTASCGTPAPPSDREAIRRYLAQEGVSRNAAD